MSEIERLLSDSGIPPLSSPSKEIKTPQREAQTPERPKNRLSPDLGRIPEMMIELYVCLRQAMADETDPQLLGLLADLHDIQMNGPAETFIDEWLEKTKEILDVWRRLLG